MAALLLLPFAGCSKTEPMGMVKGMVQLEGKPISEMSVVFQNSSTGQVGSANLASDGAYEMPKPLPLGSYKVFLAPPVEEGYVDPHPIKIDKSIPKKYLSASKSDITYDVKEGEQDYTVELKK